MTAVKRPYDAPRRVAAARETRRAIVTAASELFLEQGWTATTMAQVAVRAGVTKPTVHAVGSKADLLSLARDLAMAGDDAPVPVAQRTRFQRVLTAETAERALDLFAEHVTELQSRYAALDAVLHQASGSDDTCRLLWRVSEAQRRTGAQTVVRHLRTCQPLALPPARATDVLWTLMAGDNYRRMVDECGWSSRAYTRWLAVSMKTHLLG